MTRRTIGLLVTLALGLLRAPLLAEAPPAGKVLTIGMLNISSATANARPFEVFTHALRELGYIEGQHLTIERRYADGRPERLPALAVLLQEWLVI
jgi:ABC-type proline/glycine betaine transport system substrate-binding protein